MADMAVIYPPCKDCENRKPNCHGKCEDYKAYKEEVGKVRDAKVKRNKEIADFYEASPTYRKRKWGGGQR